MAAEVVFAWEKIGPAMADGLEDLIVYNWAEVEALDPRAPPIDIDWPRYLMLERRGEYKAVSIRRAGNLIGYNGYFTQAPLRHKTVKWAINDALYIDKAERKGSLGYRVVRRSIDMLRELGFSQVFHGDMLGPLNSTRAKPHATFGDLLLRAGARPVENTYVFDL
jgi:hypothetical protein